MMPLIFTFIIFWNFWRIQLYKIFGDISKWRCKISTFHIFFIFILNCISHRLSVWGGGLRCKIYMPLGLFFKFCPSLCFIWEKTNSINLIYWHGIDGSARKPALLQDTDYIVEKTWYVVLYLGAFWAYLMPLCTIGNQYN